MSRRAFPGSSIARRATKGGTTSLVITLVTAALAFEFLRHAVSPAPAPTPVPVQDFDARARARGRLKRRRGECVRR